MNFNVFTMQRKIYKHSSLHIIYRDPKHGHYPCRRVFGVPSTLFDNTRIHNLAEYGDILGVNTVNLSLFVGISVLLSTLQAGYSYFIPYEDGYFIGNNFTSRLHNWQQVSVHKHSLTNWPLGIWMKFYICNFQIDFSSWLLRHLLWNRPNINVTGLHWWSVNIDSGNGLVPSCKKPFTEPILTHISVAIWCH